MAPIWDDESYGLVPKFPADAEFERWYRENIAIFSRVFQMARDKYSDLPMMDAIKKAREELYGLVG